MIDVRRGAERSTTTTEWLDSRHSFSFGEHYDPGNVAWSVLVAHNDDRLEPGSGYAAHPHVDLEIVTWVLEGSLVHQDTAGRSGVLHPGLVQRMGAGRGVVHSERNDAEGAHAPTRFVQMWLRPDEAGLDPDYEQGDVGTHVTDGDLTPLVSGVAGLDAAVRVRTSGAALHLARLRPGESVDLPDAPRLHVFVARGAVDLEGAGPLVEGDAARLLTVPGGPRVLGLGVSASTGTGTGGPGPTGPHGAAGPAEPAEVLVWQLP